MILLDTHIWVWWVHGDPHLADAQQRVIAENEQGEIGINAISCWEIAKLVERGRLELPCSLEEWFAQALNYPGIRLLELTPDIAVESTRLPGTFHRDPADQIIVATARVHRCPLVTADTKILNYPHVTTIGP
jgi:PIN domain nuclease of toxin-antitoxin system